MKHPAEAARVGFDGEDPGTEMFQAMIGSPDATLIGTSTYEESWSRIPHPENKLQLVIAELLDELGELESLEPLVATTEDYPFALMAGQRRAYTANCNIRDPRWVKGRDALALTMHPEDGEAFNLPEGATVLLETETGQAEVGLAYDDRMHRGTISVPNGQGLYFEDSDGQVLPGGVFVNELTSTRYRDRFIGTPFHKFVPARVSLA